MQYRHKKRGTVYEVLVNTAQLQCSTYQMFEDLFENKEWTVYKNTETGHVWIRPTKEFYDGRFEIVGEE